MTERREPDYKTWATRLAFAAALGFIIWMMPLFSSLLQNYFSLTMASVHAENALVLKKIESVEENTKDLPILRYRMEAAEKRLGNLDGAR